MKCKLDLIYIIKSWRINLLYSLNPEHKFFTTRPEEEEIVRSIS